MQVKVTRISEETGLDANGKPLGVIRADFMVDNHGPFVMRFQKMDFNPAMARQKIDEFARGVAQLAQ